MTIHILHPKRTHVEDTKAALAKCGEYDMLVVIERAVAGKTYWVLTKRTFSSSGGAAEYTDLFTLPDEQAVRDLYNIEGVTFRGTVAFGKRRAP